MVKQKTLAGHSEPAVPRGTGNSVGHLGPTQSEVGPGKGLSKAGPTSDLCSEETAPKRRARNRETHFRNSLGHLGHLSAAGGGGVGGCLRGRDGPWTPRPQQ